LLIFDNLFFTVTNAVISNPAHFVFREILKLNEVFPTIGTFLYQVTCHF